MKIVSFLLGLLALTGAVFAQNAPKEKSLLWEISGKGLTEPSYLFGTIHLICPTDFYLSQQLKNSIGKTQQLALEIDMDDPGLMAAMTKTMFMADDKKLTDILPEKDYNQLKQFYKDSLKMDIATFGRAKPFMMMGPMFNKILGCEPQSYEISLMGLANNQKSEIIGLESIEEQMAIFDTIPYKDQIKTIITMIDSLPQARKEFSNLVALYKSQKINDLYNLMMASNYGMDGNEEVMLFARNKKWVPRIRKIAAEKPTFFAVGAGHLGGDRGVIALLRKEGFKVRAIK